MRPDRDRDSSGITMTLQLQSDLGRKGPPSRLREDLRRRHPHAAAATEFARALDALGLPQARAARIFHVSARHVRRWRSGARRTPSSVAVVVRLMLARKVTVAEVEAAAFPDPVRMNGVNTKTAPPAPLRVAPEPERSALTRTEAAPVGTAAQVYALTQTSCRFPVGDPQHFGFYFCGEPVVCRPYCQRHRRVAYLPIERRPSAPFRLNARSILPTRKLAVAI